MLGQAAPGVAKRGKRVVPRAVQPDFLARDWV
jgi:hypothetical protein